MRQLRSMIVTKRPLIAKGLREKHGQWYYRIRRRGGSEVSAPTGLEAVPQNIGPALAMREAALEQLNSGNRPVKIADLPFSNAAAEYLTWYGQEHRDKPSTSRRSKTSFASLIYFFRSRSVTMIQGRDIEAYKSWRRECHIQEVTIRHDLHALSGFFQYARLQRWMTHDPLMEVAIPSDIDAVRIHPFCQKDRDRYQSVAREVSTDLDDVTTIMDEQGCRPEEVMSLEQSHIDLFNRKLRIVHGKSRASKRSLLMTERTFEILSRRLATPGLWVFPSPRKPGCHIVTLQKPHDIVMERAGLEDYTIYDFRHRFATRKAVDDGCPIPILAALLGHANLSSISKYIHPNQRNMDEAMGQYDEAVEVSTTGHQRATFGPPPTPKKAGFGLIRSMKGRKSA